MCSCTMVDADVAVPMWRNWRMSDSSATVRTARILNRCSASITPCSPSRPEGAASARDFTTSRSTEKLASPPLIALRIRASRGVFISIGNGPSSVLSTVSSVTAPSLLYPEPPGVPTFQHAACHARLSILSKASGREPIPCPRGGPAMHHPVIPAPWRATDGGPDLGFRAGTPVAYADARLAPIVDRFCAETARRTGLHPVPAPGAPPAGDKCVIVALGPDDDLAALPAPAGLSPEGGTPADERHALTVDGDGIVVRAVEPAGAARALTTLVQLLAAAPPAGDGTIRVPGGRILDAPRYAWRGLSLDLARTYLTLDEVRRVVDLLALYKLNVLHLHLTDDQAWRLPAGRSDRSPGADAAWYEAGDLRALVAYAADRFVTIVPEVDTPGHTAALVAMHPALRTGRNESTVELAPGHTHRAVWLDPDAPATFPLVEEVMAGVADIFPGPYVHIGGDEPWGMPPDAYTAYVRRLREIVRALGRRPVGWQESARAGLGPDDVIQHWFTALDLPPSVPADLRARLDAEVARSRGDVEAAVAAGAPVILSPLSHVYLDVPYAEPAADPDQAARRRRVGLRFYPPATVESSFAWDPGTTLGPGPGERVAGVEAAVWAETVTDVDDLTFLLLPRLPGVAHRAWSAPGSATWADHRARLARHGRLWAQDGLTWFHSPGVESG